MRRFPHACRALLALALTLVVVHAVENTWDYSVQLSCTVQSSPARITLQWPQDTNGTPLSYTVHRKSPSDTNWGPGTTLPGSSTSYTDAAVSPGVVYEYQVVKAANGYTGYGYIQAAVDAPLVDYRGKVLLIVDNTLATPLASELARLERDLAGDGWTVVRHDVSRTASVTSVKNIIVTAFAADPANVRSVFLLGRVPVPYSGQLSPDYHDEHTGAWPADTYYADVDGVWSDSWVNFTQTLNTVDAARLSNRPGDGKFDPSTIPSRLELEIGRVDLSDLPGQTTWGGPATFPSEIELLRRYLNKDHNYRQRITNPPLRAIVGDYNGVREDDAFSASAYRSFGPLVGPGNIRNLNVEFNDRQGVWLPEVAANDYLFAFASGGGSYSSLSSIGSGTYNSADTVTFVNSNPRSVFHLFYGSWLGDWDTRDNFMRAALATNHGLAAAFCGHPHWFMHPLGLGETFGYATRLTQNNAGLYRNQVNRLTQGVHTTFLGDPTLRLYPVVPPRNVTGGLSGTSATLAWQASGDANIVGYHVYRAASAAGPFTRVTGAPISGLTYTDNGSWSGAVYQVRAIKLQTSPSGRYYNASQGAFWTATGGSMPPPASSTDTNAPSVAFTNPGNWWTVSGNAVAVSVAASDNVAVAGVQFRLNGAALGAEDTAAPYATTLDTTTLPNGSHTLVAVARDAAGNSSTASIIVSVSNTATSTPPPAPPPTTTPTTSPSGDVVWFDDALPAGASGGGSGGDGWNWVLSNPAPFSGTVSHQSNLASGLHEHYFGWGAGMSLTATDTIFTYVYLDPANPPTEIMLSWKSDTWEHRAYWGADQISYGVNGTASRYRVGNLPPAGQWVRLEVPATAVGLGGHTVTMMTFSQFGGRATWDKTGKNSGGTSTPPPTTTSPPPSGSATETVWFDDDLPRGASGSGSGGDTWNWVTSAPAPFSGSRAHQSALAAGLHEHWFGWGEGLTLGVGDVLFTYVYLDPATPPAEIMLSFRSDNWEHRAYWGADHINYGVNGTPGRRWMGNMPAAGQWVRLEIPASAVGLEGHTVTMMTFSQFNGRATWDKTGKASAASTSTPPPTTTTPPPTSSADTFVWLDDNVPSGAVEARVGSEGWNWVSSSPAPYSGTRAHQSILAAGLHEHYFAWGATMTLGAGDRIYTYVYLDAANPPTEIMLSFKAETWEHRAYWGADRISYGVNGTASRYRVGNLPPAGQWVRLEVAASALNLEGRTVTAMTFSTYDGRATYDKTGKSSP